MRLDAMRLVVARLLTDKVYQDGFFASGPESAPEHGLTPEEFAALRGLDPLRLGVVAEGYAGKRFERVESDFPVALALLDQLVPAARRDYLATTRFPRNDAEERATFRAWLPRLEIAPGAVRLLEDAADLDLHLLRRGPPRALADADARPRFAGPLATRGPLESVLREGIRDASTYPDAPRRLLVGREGPALVLEAADDEADALLGACDGARTLEDLARERPEAAPRLRRWLKLGVLDA